MSDSSINSNGNNANSNSNNNIQGNSNANGLTSTIQYLNIMSPIMNYANAYMLNGCNQTSPKPEPVKYSHSYSPKVKKNEEKKSKPFLEREGDWRCYQCNNLNFAFRLNCNRCHLTKLDNQKLIQQYMNVQLVNKLEFDA